MMSKEPIGESQEETISIYLGWRLARPPGGREEQPVVNWKWIIRIKNKEKIFRNKESE